jgi:predicted nucleic acid-binding protein
MLQRLNERNKGKVNNLQGVLIAETALANNLTLVTQDKDLSQVIAEFGGSTCRLQDIINVE